MSTWTEKDDPTVHDALKQLTEREGALRADIALQEGEMQNLITRLATTRREHASVKRAVTVLRKVTGEPPPPPAKRPRRR